MKLFSKLTHKNKENGVNGRYISQVESNRPQLKESCFEQIDTDKNDKIYQFKAGENYGNPFILDKNEAMRKIREELLKDIKRYEEEIAKCKDEEKDKKYLLKQAIQNVYNLDIYEIRTEEEGISRKKICTFKELGA